VRVNLILRASAGAPAQQAEVTVDPDGAVPDSRSRDRGDWTDPLVAP
jgi:hypothetical protein